MTLKLALLASTALLCSACSSPRKPPGVDESTKRPVNTTGAVDLQMCKSELTAARIVLTETLDRSDVLPASAAGIAPAPTSAPRFEASAAKPNQIFIIRFPLGSAELAVPAEQQATLFAQAEMAKFIVIRGRTDASTDSLGETRLAQRRAEAAYRYLLRAVKFPPEGVRLSWQGAGDRVQSGTDVDDRQANRRVEIELYQARPSVQVLATPS